MADEKTERRDRSSLMASWWRMQDEVRETLARYPELLSVLDPDTASLWREGREGIDNILPYISNRIFNTLDIYGAADGRPHGEDG